jgi:hypothetical protein
MLYLIKAQVRPVGMQIPYTQLMLPSRDDNVRNHNANLQAQGYEVLDVKVEPWYSEEPDEAYEQDPTPSFDEVISGQDSNTDTTTGSSD